MVKQIVKGKVQLDYGPSGIVWNFARRLRWPISESPSWFKAV